MWELKIQESLSEHRLLVTELLKSRSGEKNKKEFSGKKNMGSWLGLLTV